MRSLASIKCNLTCFTRGVIDFLKSLSVKERERERCKDLIKQRKLSKGYEIYTYSTCTCTCTCTHD